jgi:hypothetical protein
LEHRKPVQYGHHSCVKRAVSYLPFLAGIG